MMFSTYGNNDHDQKRSDNNDHTDMGESAALILTSQYLDNTNRNYSFFNPPNSMNNHNPIFIQPEQMDSYSSTEPSAHEHLMILATAAVNSSPSNDSCKSGGNTSEATIIGAAESPHFSIHDPPLIRLSPTSPNNLFRHGRYSDEFQGMTNATHNSGYSPNNVDWLSQELYVKTETGPGELTHSGLKRHSFNNSLSDTEFAPVRARGRSHVRHNEPREFDHSNNSSTHLRSRKDLKRRRLFDAESDYNAMVNSQHNTPNSVDDYTTNLNTSTFINLTESDGESQVDDRSNRRGSLTPELPRRHFQWWPIKRHCTDATNEEQRANRDLPGHTNVSSQAQTLVTSSNEVLASPMFEVGHITSQFSPCSPPFYMCPGNNNPDQFNNYPVTADHISNNSEISNNGIYSNNNNLHSQPHVDTSSPISPLLSNPMGYQPGDPRTTSSNVSSYLRHILVPQLYNRRRYAVSNLPTTFRDFSRLYLPQSLDRPYPYRATSQTGHMESDPNYPRRSSSGSFVQATIYEPEGHSTQGSQQSPSSRSLRLSAPVNDGSEDQHLLSNPSYRRHNIPASMNTFLRAYGLEEVQQRHMNEPYPELRDPRLHNDSVRIHPLLRISERNFLNPMLDNRPGSQFSRPFAMYESQGNVESVIQLALHLETSWRGISPEELCRLPCHYYNEEHIDSLNHSDKQDKCMVCLDEFMANDQLRTLSCGHQYHVTCVDKWLKMNRTCPMCRSDAVLGSSSYLYVN